MISHEVNNSMGAVNSIIDSTTHYLRDFKNALEVAKQRISNLSDFTKRFTDVVRIPQPEIQDCDLIEVILQQLGYLHIEFETKNIVVKTHFNDTEKVLVKFDVQQLELVLVNIIKNAVQAIGTHGDIAIQVQTSPLILSISNDGIPITEKIREKLFTPFFTTKKTGQGIGLT